MGRHYQVVIVGGGPVGVALALDLGLRGISCALIESRTEMHQIPKGQNLTQRTLEHFYFWGIADELRAARLMPKGAPIGEITAYGNLMSPYWHAPAGREVVRPFYFQDNERLPQYRMEAVLRAKLASVPIVQALFGWTATALKQDDSGVRVAISDAAGNSEEVSGDYLVGCDGARSIVRDATGIERSITDFDRLMVLTVFRSRALHQLLERFPRRSTYRVMHPDFEGYWQFLGRIDVGEGFFFHAPVARDTKREGFDFRGPLRRATGADFDFELDYGGFWDLRNAVAETYRVDRVFIAGDAAHSHPPYGGFGLNNGLEDAVNLSWKLVGVLQGWGGEGLLDSYSEERGAVFRDVAENFIAARVRADGEFLARYNPGRDKAEFEQAWRARETNLGTLVKSYEPNYEGSAVVYGPSDGVSTASGQHILKARAGHHLAPQKLSSGRDVYEALGRGFNLLAFDAPDGEVEALAQGAKAQAVPLTVIKDSLRDGRETYESRFVLVRPDQFVAWTGDAAPRDPNALWRKLSGHG